MRRLTVLLVAALCVGLVAMPATAQQTGTPTADEPATEDEPADPTVQSPSGSPVTYNSPTPTEAEGPGVGALGALVAGILGTAVAVRRRD